MDAVETPATTVIAATRIALRNMIFPPEMDSFLPRPCDCAGTIARNDRLVRYTKLNQIIQQKPQMRNRLH